MQKIIPTTLVLLSALTMIGGSAMAASDINSNNIVINCGTAPASHAHGGVVKRADIGNTHVTVNCNGGGGGGGTGPQGPPGPRGETGAVGPQGERGLPGVNGQNATITILTVPSTNSTAGSQHFDTKHFTCNSLGVMVPFNCVKK